MERIPLLKDSHNHLYIYSSLSDALDLSVAKSKEEALVKLKNYSSNRDISVAIGWNSSRFPLSAEDFSHLPPIVVCNSSLHGFILNSEAATILKDYNEEVCLNIDNSDWVERNLPEVMGFVSSITGFKSEKVDMMLSYLLSKGIYCQDDMYAGDEDYIKYIINSDLKERIGLWTGIKIYRELTGNLRDSIKGIKIFTDGALGTETAALDKGFSSGNRGILIWNDEELEDMLCESAGSAGSVAVHALGDLAVEQVLRVYSRIAGGISLDVRMEHCQFITKQQASRARDLGITLSLQPNFSWDSVKYADRLPQNYREINCAFRMLIDEVGFRPGKNLILGSDGMPHGFEFALQQSLFPPLEIQKLTLEEFVEGYCIDNMVPGHIEIDIDKKNREIKGKVIQPG